MRHVMLLVDNMSIWQGNLPEDEPLSLYAGETVVFTQKTVIPPAEEPPVISPPPDEEEEPVPPPPPPSDSFTDALLDAWHNDKPLNWTGGNVTLKTPLELLAITNKTNFHLNMNNTNVYCDFNNPNAYALTLKITEAGLNIREFGIEEIRFRKVTPYAGGIKLECNRNDSWIYSFSINDIAVAGHSGHGIWLCGSVFECDLNYLKSTNGLGLFRATERGANTSDPTGADGNRGLPSAIVGKNWRPRDFIGHAIQLDSSTPWREPFDLRLVEGYVVTGLGDGMGLYAPAGVTLIEGVGFENLRGGAAMYIGYRGGRVIRCQASNPIAGSKLGVKNSDGSWGVVPVGMAYLVHAQLTGSIELAGCSIENYGNGSGLKLAKLDDWQGGGRIILDPSRSHFNGDDIDTNFPNDKFSIVAYRNRT